MRKYASQKKGEKTVLKVTRRGSYMDYDLKVAKSVPGSSKTAINLDAYHMTDSWDGSADRKKSQSKKFDPKLLKYSYLDRIEI